MNTARLYEAILPYLPYLVSAVVPVVAILIARRGRIKFTLPGIFAEFNSLLSDPAVQRVVATAISLAEQQKTMTGPEKREFAISYTKKWLGDYVKGKTAIPDFIVNLLVEKVFAELGGLK